MKATNPFRLYLVIQLTAYEYELLINIYKLLINIVALLLDGLGALRHGVLGQLTGEDEAHGGLNLAGGQGGLGVSGWTCFSTL